MARITLSIEILALLLSVLGIAYALIHKKRIDAQSVKLSDLTNNLQSLAAKLGEQLTDQTNSLKETKTLLSETRQSLTTRSIGVFPQYLSDITKLISRAKKITIVCDFPGYGHYSDYDDWFEYRTAIQRKSDADVPITLICFDEGPRLQHHNSQFSQAVEDWPKWKAGQGENLLKFLRRHGRGTDIIALKDKVETLSQGDFADLLEETDQEMLHGAFGAANKKLLKTDFPFYFWLIEGNAGEEAIFAIPSFSDKQLEYGFFTSDSKITSAFAEMAKRYTDDATRDSTPVSDVFLPG